MSGTGETLEIDGTLYEDVVIRSTSPSHITISHRGGISQIPMADLPPQWQEACEYDPAVAARHQARVEAQTRYRLKQDEAARPKTTASPAGTNKLKRQIDFRIGKPSSFTRAKDQGRRPVNGIYAVVTALEYAYSRNTAPVSLSEEFVLWAIQKTYPDLEFGQGAIFTEIIKSIEIHGICAENLCPNMIERPLNEVEPPSAEAINDALQRRNIRPIPVLAQGAEALAQILFNLNQGRPVVIALRWPDSKVLRQNATLRRQTPKENSIHLVTLIGYRPDPEHPEAILLLFRNSSGPQWGTDGHGYLALDYLNQNLIGGFAMDLF